MLQENRCPITTTDTEQPEGSQVARCLREIVDQYSAAQRELSGYAETSKHAFITARMERMQASHEELINLIGSDAAIHMVAERLDQVQEVRHV